MGRFPRRLISGQPYEVVFRTKEGLPLVATLYMKVLIESVLARAQRDDKVDLCHLVTMGNHFHIIVVIKDAHQATRFYKEVKKGLTEVMKRLFGLSYLTLWDRSTVIHLATAQDVIRRIAYLYANPAAANLVDTIARYPGVSSWRAFTTASKRVAAELRTIHPWVRAPQIPQVEEAISLQEDIAIASVLKKQARASHELTYKPYIWLRSFGLTDEDTEWVHEKVCERLERREQAAQRLRRIRKATAMGPMRLRKAKPTLSGYQPKKRERKIFVICRDKELRLALLNKYQQFKEKCQECYRAWRDRGELVPWPSGAFRPSLSRAEVSALD